MPKPCYKTKRRGCPRPRVRAPIQPAPRTCAFRIIGSDRPLCNGPYFPYGTSTGRTRYVNRYGFICQWVVFDGGEGQIPSERYSGYWLITDPSDGFGCYGDAIISGTPDIDGWPSPIDVPNWAGGDFGNDGNTDAIPC